MNAVIAVDAGNTRIKWGVHDGRAWLAQGALDTGAAGNLAELAGAWPQDAPLAVCNVAGAAVESALGACFAARRGPLCWLRASAAACGVENRYERPETLGADRWAALIGARGSAATDATGDRFRAPVRESESSARPTSPVRGWPSGKSPPSSRAAPAGRPGRAAAPAASAGRQRRYTSGSEFPTDRERNAANP